MKKAQIGVEAHGPEKRARFTAAARAGICLNGPAESRPVVGHHRESSSNLVARSSAPLNAIRSSPGRNAMPGESTPVWTARHPSLASGRRGICCALSIVP